MEDFSYGGLGGHTRVHGVSNTLKENANIMKVLFFFGSRMYYE